VIQRPQTVYLALTAVLNLVFFFTPLFTHAQADPGDWLFPMLTVALAFSGVISVYAIFLFQPKKIPTQIKWTQYGMIFQAIGAGTAIAVLFTIGNLGSQHVGEISSAGILLIGFFLQFMAVNGMKKDNRKLKSVDRLRD